MGARPPTILYIEDDPGSQALVQRALQFAGYQVHVAGTGLRGIDLAKAHQPDLILMDINLPDLSGREVATRLRAIPAFQATPIVALTAQSHAGEREKALAAGLDGYLTKPVDVDGLATEVQDYLGGKRDRLGAEALSAAQAAYSQEVVERLERKIREVEGAYAELRRLDKLKEAFVQLTAHELRTPLTLLVGYGRQLHDSPDVTRMLLESSEAQDLVSPLLSAIDRMAGAINEILLISRVASGRVELTISPVRVEPLVERVLNDYQAAINQRDQHLRVDLQHAPEKIWADRDLLTLALNNLVGNAIKYTPDGGLITLRALQQGDNLLLTVQDTGIGIDPGDQPLIFDTFYTAGNTQLHSTSKVAFRGGGLGLGLAICAEIVKAHEGRLWVDSPGRDEAALPGSVFSVSLPVRSRVVAPLLPTPQAGQDA